MQTAEYTAPTVLTDEELVRLWGQVGRNIPLDRLTVLMNGGDPRSVAETAFAETRQAMIDRNLSLY
jgi:hypothetical protein